MTLITVMPEQIQSASMTADWEEKLIKIEKGKFESEEFLSEISQMITDVITTYKVIEDAAVLMHPAEESIGICPCCSKNVLEKQKGFFCENKACKFALWKDNRFFDALSKKMNKQVAQSLLRDGKVKLKKCRSVKTGKTYDTTVAMSVDDEGRIQYKMEFENRGHGKER